MKSKKRNGGKSETPIIIFKKTGTPPPPPTILTGCCHGLIYGVAVGRSKIEVSSKGLKGNMKVL